MHQSVNPDPVTEINLPLTGIRAGKRKQIVTYATVLNDKFALDVLAKMSWYLSKGYPATNVTLPSGRRTIVYLHHLVFREYHGPIPPGHEVDHRDRNPLNVLPTNLRPVTRSINIANSGPRKTNKLGIKGICVTTIGKKTYYLAQVMKNRKRVLYKTYPHTPTGLEEAIAAHREAYARAFPEVTLDPISLTW